MKSNLPKRIAGFFAATLVAVVASAALAAQTTFQMTIGTPGPEADRAPWVDRTCDGGYIVAANHATDPASGRNYEGYVLKLKANGDIEWERLLETPLSTGNDTALLLYKVKPVSDGGFIVVGEFYDGVLDYAYLCKLDPQGTVQWSRTYRGRASSGAQGGPGVDETPDGGFIVAMGIQGTGNTQESPLLLRTDRNGLLVWSQYYTDSRFGVDTFGRFNGVKVTADGNYVACGNTCFGVGGPRETLLIKTDLNGTILWSHTYDLPGYDVAFGLDTAANGDQLVVGTKDLGEGGATFVLRTTPAGAVIWYKTFAAFSQFGSIEELPTGDIILGGTDTSSFVDNWDPSLLKLDAAGVVQWCKAYGYAPGLNDYGYNVVPAHDGGFFLAAETRTAVVNQEHHYDLYLIKTDDAGLSGCNERDHNSAPGVDAPPVADVVFNSYALTYESPITTLVGPPNGKETILCRTVVLPPCLPPPPDMVGWWPLDELAGVTAADITGTMNNAGVHMNSPTPVPGMVAGALHFSQASMQYVEAPHQAELELGLGDFTIDAWIRLDSFIVLDAPIVSKWDGSGGYYWLVRDGHLSLVMSAPSGSWVFYIPAAGTLPLNTDLHVAVTVRRNDPSGLQFYVNGLPHGLPLNPTGQNTVNLNNPEPLRIGASRFEYNDPLNPEWHYFDGVIDEVELFTRALAPCEIARIYGAGPSGKCKSEIARPCLLGIEWMPTGSLLHDLSATTGLATYPRNTGLTYPTGLEFDPSTGELFTITSQNANNSLLKLSRSTGATLSSTPITTPQQLFPTDMTEGDLAICPPLGAFPGWIYYTERDSLYRMTQTGLNQTYVGTVPLGAQQRKLSGIAFDSAGRLFALDTAGNSSEVFELTDPDNTANTFPMSIGPAQVVSTPLGRLAGFDYDPVSSVFYVVDSIAGGANRLFTIDVTTGAVTPRPNPTGTAFGFSGLAVVPCECRPDLWVKDTMAPDLPEDFGVEPNAVSSPLFVSSDIWVRNAADTLTSNSSNPGHDSTAPVDKYYVNEHQHQNPTYVSGTMASYIYVKVRNRGCEASTGNEQLRVYWADASTGLPWPGSGIWNEIDCVTGGAVDPCTLPVIAPGQDFVAELPWIPPNPATFGGNQHFCLVARIETQPVAPFGMAYTEGPALWQNVANNNNIAWKNLTVIDGGEGGGHVIVRNTFTNAATLTLRFSVPATESSNHFLLHGGIKVDLGAALKDKWIAGGQPATGFTLVNDTTQVQITDPTNAVLGGLRFSPGEEQMIEVQMQLNPSDPSSGGTIFNWDVMQLASLATNVEPVAIGGERYTYIVGLPDTRPPSITSSSTNQTGYEFETAQFFVSATGALPLSYQWAFNGSPLPNETNATLVIRSLLAEDAGDYAVTVSNEFGSVTSAVASLAVEFKLEVDPQNPGYERGVLLAKFAPDLGANLASTVVTSTPISRVTFPASLQALHQQLGVTHIAPVYRNIGPTPQNLAHTFQLTVPFDRDMAEAAVQYAVDANVLFAEPNFIAHADYTPNDQYFNAAQLWGIFKVGAQNAWNTARGNGITVAVVDTGVNTSHGDLACNAWVNGFEIAGNGIDDDGNGYIDDVSGWDFVANANTPQNDQSGHGTHVAGTIAACGNNLKGVAGLAFNATIMPVRFLDANGSGTMVGGVNAMVYAVKNGARSMNNSWGGSVNNTILQTVEWAHSQGVLVVSAAGNANKNACSFSPANSEYGMTIAASKNDDTKAAYSNWGVKVDVAAPGGAGGSPSSLSPATDILSTVPPSCTLLSYGFPVLTGIGGDKYIPLAGTSMAAPHVSALAALIWQQQPGWTHEEVKQVIRQSANDVNTSGFDIASGYGRINAAQAVQVSAPPPTASLVEPRNCAEVTGIVTVKGYASAFGFNLYSMDIGSGTSDPIPWMPLFGGTIPVSGGTLGSFNSALFPQGTYTLRVRTYGVSGVSEDRNEIFIKNVQITAPKDCSHNCGNLVAVQGTVDGGGLIQWNLFYKAYGQTVFSGPIASGSTAISTPTTLLNWNLAGIPEGPCILKLEGTYSGSIVQKHEVTFLVDKLCKAGWPVGIEHKPTMKSPKIADLNQDGLNEVVLGSAVFRANGSVFPGWNSVPGLGRANSAVLDLDGNANLEVVAADFTSYDCCDNGAQNLGAPVIRAYRYNKTVLWSYPVVNSSSIYNHGVPSSVSAGDVDGDGKPEIVFTVVFKYNNTVQQTTLYVLDGATGALKLKQNFPGKSMSSVALPNVDNDPALEMVLSTSAGVYVINGNGSVVSGWPQTPGSATIDPVVADVDGDCDYEILVGQNLWHHTGLPYTGWPVPFIARSTGALAQQDLDQNLEVILGGGNHVVYWRNDDNGALNHAKTDIDENLFVSSSIDNHSQGVPIVGDVNGDGIPDMVRPPALGKVGSCFARVYGGLAITPTSPANFPRWVVEPDYIVRSSACIGDLDKDGKADLLITAGGKIYAWNLGTTWNGHKDPWPMFQGNLANTGTLPRKKSCVDLWSPDTPVGLVSIPDTGIEPNATMSPPMFWLSRSLIVRHAQDNGTVHQNPEYGQVNYIYANIRNGGAVASSAVKVEVYYGVASTGLGWPAQWTVAGSAYLPSVAGFGSVRVNVPWSPPGTGHYALMARIVSTEDPMTFAEGLNPVINTRDNNNLAFLGVSVVNLWLAAGDDYSKLIVRHLGPTNAALSLRFTDPDDFVEKGGRLTLDLGTLFERWVAGGRDATNVTVLAGNLLQIGPGGAELRNLAMDANEEAEVRLGFHALLPLNSTNSQPEFFIGFEQWDGNEAVGGVGYLVTASGLPDDTDRDGLPNGWEEAYGLDPNNPGDAGLDTDGDGHSNLQEYIAGTNPSEPSSVLRLDVHTFGDGTLALDFLAASNRTYSVIQSGGIGHGSWSNLLVVPKSVHERPVSLSITNGGEPVRSFQIITPERP